MQIITEVKNHPLTFPFKTEAEQFDAPRLQKWTTGEYHRLSELGFFDGKRTELIGGEIIVKHYYYNPTTGETLMGAMSSAHFTGVNLAGEAMRRAFGEGFIISVQCPLDFGEGSEPEPDVAVIVGNTRDFTDALPQTAALIIEVAESSLAFDRGEKASLYASAGILDYWVVNLRDRRLESRRRPIEDVNARFGFSYGDVSIFNENDSASPLANLNVQIAVADLLP